MMSIGPKQRTKDAPSYYAILLIQQLILALIMSVLVFVSVLNSASVFPEWNIQQFAIPLAVVSFGFQLQDFFRRYFFTRERSLAAFVSDAVRYLGQLVLLIWIFIVLDERLTISDVLWIIAVFASVSAIGSWFCVGNIQMEFSKFWLVSKRHWNFAKWLTGTAIMHWTLGNFFIIVAGVVLGPVAVGALKAAQNVMGVTHILFMGLENVVPVRAAALLKQNNMNSMKLYMKNTALFGGLSTLAVAVIAAIAPEFWLGLIFGEEYLGYGFLLRWYAGIYMLMFIAMILRFGLRALEKTNPIFWAYFMAGIFSILAAYPLTTHFGLNGVLGGTTAIYLIMITKLWLDLSKQMKRT